MTSLRSPLDLCDRLGLRPFGYHEELMRSFYESDGDLNAYDALGNADSSVDMTVGVCALWRLLRYEDSSCVIISDDQARGDALMRFLYELTARTDPSLGSICTWHGRRSMGILSNSDNTLRFISNMPGWLLGMKPKRLTAVVLGAGSTDTAFNETLKVMETFKTQPNTRILYVW